MLNAYVAHDGRNVKTIQANTGKIRDMYLETPLSTIK